MSTETKQIILSEEQQAIAQHILSNSSKEEPENLIVNALPGTGKTTTCLEVIPLMRGSVVYLVFGKKNADEAKAKFAAKGVRADVGTFHSFGARAIRNAYPNSKIEGKKGRNVAGFYKEDKIFDEIKVPD